MPAPESPSKLVPMPFRALYAIAFLCVSVAPAVSAEPEIARTEIIQISEAPAPEVLASANILQADPTFSEKRMYREIFPGPESRTGAVIGSQAEKVAGTLTEREIALRLQQHVDAAVAHVDALGEAAFTPRQLEALVKHPKFFDAFRGNRIDVMARESIMNDADLVGRLRSNYTKGPDFVDTITRRWYDMTTTKQWGAHVKRYLSKYGADGVHLITDKL